MFKKVRTKALGKVIANRVENYTVWEKLPKKRLKKHPINYVLCPDFPVAIPKVISKEAGEVPYVFTVKIVAKTKPVLREMLDHMIICAQEDVIVGDKRFELCGFRESTVKIGVYMADLTYIFKLRQLSYGELKKIKSMEENHG